MEPAHKYTPQYYRRHHTRASSSARVILPLVFQAAGRPASIIDVGCGDGAWLDVALELRALELAELESRGSERAAAGAGVVVDLRGGDAAPPRCVGVDGSWVDPPAVAHWEFTARDLERPLAMPCGHFDLAISLETAADLAPVRGPSFVADLVALSDVVLFSSAPPGQPHEPHRNRRWPSYWVDRFAEHDYTVVDAVRAEVWCNPNVAPWYAQNCLLFVANREIERSARLAKLARARGMPLDVVHPRLAQPAWDELRPATAARALVDSLARALQRTKR